MSNTYSNTYHHSTVHRFSLAGIAAIVAAHLALLVLLTTLRVIPLPTALAPLMVQIVPSAATPTPQISPPVPKPPERKVTPQPTTVPRLQPQMIAAQTPATASESTTAVVNNTPAPPTPPSTTVTQARFDADYLQNPAPSYPALSRRLGEEGKVILRVQVEANGRPGQIEVRSSSGSPRLDQSALDAVARWKFIPAKRGDETISAWVLVPIVFNLKY
jgi:protein TonB